MVIQPVQPVDLFWNQSSSCLFDSDCNDSNSFCSQPPLSQLRGVCTSCWRCSLFPSIYGQCPSSCNAIEGLSCSFPTDCGLGLFCGLDQSNGAPICRSCSSCLSDTDALYGNCSLSCPSGALSSSSYQGNINDFIFLSFSAAEISSTAGSYSNGTMQPGEVSAWLNSQGLSSNQTLSTLSAFSPASSYSAAPIPVSIFVDKFLASTSLSVICPGIPPSSSSPVAKTVYPGCPCNATARAATFACQAGYRCSPSAYKGLSLDLVKSPTLGRLEALCVACEPGQYCPQGTFLSDESDLSSLDCPKGRSCPTPSSNLPCPAGSFCVGRTVDPITCDYNWLLNNAPYTIIPSEGSSVIQRLRSGGDPLKGNICPVGSTSPSGICPSGKYCPNVTSSFVCPAGYFCKAQSISPRLCSILTSCPEGTGTPLYSRLVFVILGVVVASMPLVWLLLYYLDTSAIATYEELKKNEIKRNRAVKMHKGLLNSFKRAQADVTEDVNHNSSTSKYAGFGQIQPRIKLEFQNLGMRLKNKAKVILQGVSGSFPAGKLNAVLGPSGSGKTTFLNVLCGKVGRSCVITGQIRINDEPMPLAKLRKVMGFVPQDDIVHADLTIRENLAYAASLRLPLDVNNRRRRPLVIDDALDILQLKAIQHYQVGSVEKRGISGGQRKRVNIGLELVSQPSILFLDEPTSGLDSTASSDILGSLSDMTGLGMTIIAVIHQPRYSSFNLFDQVLLLGTGGRTVYMGPPGIAVIYFRMALGFSIPKNENPADMLMDIIGGKMARDGDPWFKPQQLFEWWEGKGKLWVSEFEHRNRLMKREDFQMDPQTLQDIDEAFDEVDVDATGRINADQLMDMFDLLGMSIAHEDAALLVSKIVQERASGGGASETESGVKSKPISAGGVSDDSENSGEALGSLVKAVPQSRASSNTLVGGNRPGSANRPKLSSTGAPSKMMALLLPGYVGGNGSAPGSRRQSTKNGSSGGGALSPGRSPGLSLSDQPAPSVYGMSAIGKILSGRWGEISPASEDANKAPGSVATIHEDLEQAFPKEHEPTITKAQLMRALETTYNKKLADTEVDPMERFATDGTMQYNIPPIIVTESDAYEPNVDAKVDGSPARQHDQANPWSNAPVRTFPPNVDRGPVGEGVEDGLIPLPPLPLPQEDQPHTSGLDLTQLCDTLHENPLSSPGDKRRAVSIFSNEAESDDRHESTPAHQKVKRRVTMVDGEAASASTLRSPAVIGTSSGGFDAAQGSPARFALSQGGKSKPARRSRSASKSRNGGPERHTQGSVWAEGLLAGAIHQMIERRKVTEGGFGILSPPPGHPSTNGAEGQVAGTFTSPTRPVTGSGVRKDVASPAAARAIWTDNGSGKKSDSPSKTLTASEAGMSPTKASTRRTGGGGLEGAKSSGFDGIMSDLKRRNTTHGGDKAMAMAGRAHYIQNEIGRRKFPNVLTQLILLLQRGSIKYLRSFWPLRVIDILLLLTAAFIIGYIHTTGWGIGSVPSNAVMAMTCLGVLSTVTHLRTFSLDRVLLTRESSSGISIDAHFLSQNLIDLIWILLSPALFLGPYFYLTLPRQSFSEYYIVAVFVCWWTSGMAYLISALLPPSTVLMTGVFVALILGAFVQGLTPTIASSRGTFLEVLMGISYNRWAMEAITINELNYNQDNMRISTIMIFKGIGLCGMDQLLVVDGGDKLTPREAISFLKVQKTFESSSYCAKYETTALGVLIGLGAAFRIIAWLVLKFVKRSQY